MFDEMPCPPSITHMLYVNQGGGRGAGGEGGGKDMVTRAFDRPALFIEGTPGQDV
jgi:hypothetical protein